MTPHPVRPISTQAPATAPDAGLARSCGIAARLGERLACRPGGCRLARELGWPPDTDARVPCPLELLALRAPACPLAVATLDGLRRAMERPGGSDLVPTATEGPGAPSASRLRRARLAAEEGRARHRAEALAGWPALGWSRRGDERRGEPSGSAPPEEPR